jgi:hypothetical protein
MERGNEIKSEMEEHFCKFNCDGMITKRSLSAQLIVLLGGYAVVL